jgi:HlyD family secretion protein
MRRVIFIFAAALLGLVACSRGNDQRAQGYVEGEYLYVGPQVSGRIDRLAVAKGDWVPRDGLLFHLDETEAQANLAQAEATLKAAELDFARTKDLRSRRVVSQSVLDEAERRFDTARAALDQAKWHVAERAVTAPTSGVIANVFFRVGEVVAAGQPVVSVLPPENTKVRFFVREPQLAILPLGAEVGVVCDSCQDGLTARVVFVASEAEFTPPVIFSRETRDKLVFKVEAALVGPAQALKVGQPVEIELPRKAAGS